MTNSMRKHELETLAQLEPKLARCCQRLESGQTRTVLQLDLLEFLTVARALLAYKHRLEKVQEVKP